MILIEYFMLFSFLDILVVCFIVVVWVVVGWGIEYVLVKYLLVFVLMVGYCWKWMYELVLCENWIFDV